MNNDEIYINQTEQDGTQVLVMGITHAGALAGGDVKMRSLEELDDLIDRLVDEREWLSCQAADAMPKPDRWVVVVNHDDPETGESVASVHGTYADERDAHADAARVGEPYLPGLIGYEVCEVQR